MREGEEREYACERKSEIEREIERVCVIETGGRERERERERER